MRILVSIAVVAASTTAQARPTGYVAARLAIQHVAIDKDDGAPDAWGPRFELAAGLHLQRWISLSAVAAVSSYSDSQLLCRVLHESYDIHVRDVWLGGRVIFHPHRFVFAGLGYARVFTKERTEYEGASPRPPSTLTFSNGTWELVAGANVYRTPQVIVQALVVAGAYDRFDGLEHVAFLSLGAGVQF